jgi:sporulation protein YlmC with PRC-barrel domain
MSTHAHVRDDIIGKEVIAKDGTDLGEVRDATVDTDSWRVVGLVVKLNRDVLERLNLRRPLVGTQEIQVPVGDITGVADRIVLRKAVEEYAKLGGEGDDPPAD